MNSKWLSVARAAWLAAFALGALVLLLGLPLHWRQWTSVCGGTACRVGQLTPQQAAQLPALGWTFAGWATSLSLLWHVAPLAGLAIALIIFVRRGDDPMALFTSFVLVASSIGGIADYASASPALQALESAWVSASNISVALLLLVFPDGRFVPRWTRWLVPLPFVVEAFSGYFVGRANIVNPASAALWLLFVLLQLNRYRRVSNAVQRQQTKWVVFLNAVGLTALGAGGLVFAAFYPLETLSPPASLALYFGIMFCLLAFPVSIAMAVLRARLWDIDLIIRRTLIYGALTGLLALVYFGSVLLLQALFILLTGQQRSELVTVLSTLAIAALFVPLRGRLQGVIDQRFYRRRYDSAHTLSAFGVQVRDQVELERLTDELVSVVQQTMQPAQVSLWLPGPNPPGPPSLKGRGSKGINS